jgi:DNA-binding MarR family transcriptional regulator
MNLTPDELSVLREIDRLSKKGSSACSMFDPNATFRELESKDLVAFYRIEGDRRMTLIFLTPSGRDALNAANRNAAAQVDAQDGGTR